MTLPMIVLLILFICVTAFKYGLKFINLNYLKIHGLKIPEVFAGQIDEEMLQKTSDYTVEHNRFDTIDSIFDNILILIFIFGGLLSIYNEWILTFQLPFILSGLVFFAILSLVSTVLDIPFDLYSTFKIEAKYGFNTKTVTLWLTDLLKSIVISLVLMAIIGGIGFWIITASPHYWWVWIWAFFLVFSLFLMYISPYVIEPLFNKFTPIAEDYKELEEKIKTMFEKIGIKVSRVFKIDASKRSKHTNAYFTGIGKVKRIVLYDTLLDNMTEQEILAVLAHEAGHWKKKHILKRILVSEIIGFIGIYISFRLLESDLLSSWFNMHSDTFFAKLILLSFVGGIITFPFSPLSAYFSRKHERQADQIAVNLTGAPDGLFSALVKLSKDNLSNLHPHPFFAKWYYSHPPIVERLNYIKNLKPEKV